MDYNTLKDILYNMPEDYKDVIKSNPKMADVIKQDVILNALIEHGIFKDELDYYNQCKERYNNIREETKKEIERYEQKNEK